MSATRGTTNTEPIKTLPRNKESEHCTKYSTPLAIIFFNCKITIILYN